MEIYLDVSICVPLVPNVLRIGTRIGTSEHNRFCYDRKAGWRGTSYKNQYKSARPQFSCHQLNAVSFLACAMFARSQFLVLALFDFLLLIFSFKLFLLRNYLRFPPTAIDHKFIFWPVRIQYLPISYHVQPDPIHFLLRPPPHQD